MKTTETGLSPELTTDPVVQPGKIWLMDLLDPVPNTFLTTFKYLKTSRQNPSDILDT